MGRATDLRGPGGGTLLAAIAALLLSLTLPTAASAASVDAGSLRAEQRGTALTLTQPGSPGSTLRLAGTQPAGLVPKVERVGEGLIRVRFDAPATALKVRASFVRPEGERFLGFGERSDAVVRGSGTVEHRVTEGPFQPIERPFVAAFVPLPGYDTRDDMTYYPLPWLLSTRGYGVLIENDDQSRNVLGSPWSAEVDARMLSLLIVAGPTPRRVLDRFSAHVGRQPPVMRPAWGPWWQRASGTAPDEEWLEILGKRGALGAVGQTYLHYLPCADQVGRRDAEKERTALYRRAGLITTTYFNPMICTSHPRYEEAAANGWLTKNALGEPYVYRYTGSTVFLVGQIDFRAPGAIGFYRSLLEEAFEDGHIGWMEDFGEYTPDDGFAHDGTTGSAGHNAYARDYHLGVHRAAGKGNWIRYVRSGWTGSAAGSPVVWNGDPTTGWEFDGLESAITNGLSIGLSGVSRWGSDIGGFFALSEQQTTPELLNRWIEMGFASGVMRTQGNGFGLGPASGTRAQIIDDEVLPVWARWAKLRTRFFPELLRWERAYRRRGMPIMRHHALTHRGDPRAVAREDQYMFGPSILVAPVIRPGQQERTLYLPKGRWVDVWRSASPNLRKLEKPRVIRGGREVTVPAPLEELPMLVRMGSRLELLAKGGPTWKRAVKRGQKRRSILAWGGRKVRIRGPRVRRYDVQWTRANRPSRLMLGGKRVPFRYRDGVVRASVKTGRGVLRVR